MLQITLVYQIKLHYCSVALIKIPPLPIMYQVKLSLPSRKHTQQHLLQFLLNKYKIYIFFITLSFAGVQWPILITLQNNKSQRTSHSSMTKPYNRSKRQKVRNYWYTDKQCKSLLYPIITKNFLSTSLTLSE